MRSGAAGVDAVDDDYLWAGYYSVDSWLLSNRWAAYLAGVEKILDDKIIRLDDKDPVRRHSTGPKSDAEFIVAFGPKESSRWLFGKLKNTKIQFSIVLYKHGKDSFERLRENSIIFYVPKRIVNSDMVRQLYQLFNFTSEYLVPFYAYSDLREVIISKKSCSGGALNLSRELIGVCWLTYFGTAYRSYFGEKLVQLDGVQEGPNGGVTLRLAASPTQVGATVRDRAMKQLGRASFADGPAPKEAGQFAITLQTLVESNLT